MLEVLRAYKIQKKYLVMSDIMSHYEIVQRCKTRSMHSLVHCWHRYPNGGKGEV